MRCRAIVIGFLPAFLLLTAAAQTRSPRRPAGTRAPSAAAEKPKYKGIFEPVNYDQDVKLMSVSCSGPQSCWAAGGASEIRGGVILHTADQGKTWTVEAGDPQSADRAFVQLRFLDGHTGFAVQHTGQASNLYRTDDGEHWLPVGKIAEHIADYHFSSPTTGVAVGGESIDYTQDAGKTWNPVAHCRANAQVNGLARSVKCNFLSLSFPTGSTGYAAAKSDETDQNLFLAKTTDGGASWTMMTLDIVGEHPGPKDVYFVNADTGFLRVGGADTGKLYKTTNGGQTWTAIATSPGERMSFSSDKAAAWAFHYSRMGFSADGGEHWSTRQERFPATPWDASLPRANFGMVVGEHGMAYRYRIVPAAYTAKGMLDAPALSSTPTP